MKQYTLWGKWISRFIFGFPAAWSFSQEAATPHSDNARPPIATARIWGTCDQRFRDRSRASGRKNATPLRDEAMGQVREGRFGEPIPFPLMAIAHSFPYGIPMWPFGLVLLRGGDLLRATISGAICLIYARPSLRRSPSPRGIVYPIMLSVSSFRNELAFFHLRS